MFGAGQGPKLFRGGARAAGAPVTARSSAETVSTNAESSSSTAEVEGATNVDPAAVPQVEAATNVDPAAVPLVEAATNVGPAAVPLVEAATNVDQAAVLLVEAASDIDPVAVPLANAATNVDQAAVPLVEAASDVDPVAVPLADAAVEMTPPIVPPVEGAAETSNVVPPPVVGFSVSEFPQAAVSPSPGSFAAKMTLVPASPTEVVWSLMQPAFVMRCIHQMLRHSLWQIAQPKAIMFNYHLAEESRDICPAYGRFIAHCQSESIARAVLTHRATAVENMLPERQEGAFTYLFLGATHEDTLQYLRHGIDRKALGASFFSTDPEQCKSSAGIGPDQRKYTVLLFLTTARPVKDPNGRENVWVIPAESFSRMLPVAMVDFLSPLPGLVN